MPLPLITIVVVTYNSGKYVKETLDSISVQTYKGPIQLIISDDNSQDETLDICVDWLKKNAHLFSGADLLTSENNTGISGNYNRALRIVRGEWVKYIAGDDILCDNCIDTFVKETKKTTDKFIMCMLQPFDKEGYKEPRMRADGILDGDVKHQEQKLSELSYIIEGPSFFLETDTLNAMHGFDEKYPYVEDWPLAMKYTYNGFHIHLLKEPLVRYREYQSVSKEGSEYYKKFWWCCYASLNDWRMTIAKRDRKYLEWWHARVQRFLLDIPKSGLINKVKRYLLMISDLKRFI